MTEDEFSNSLVGQALNSYRGYMEDLTGFVDQFRTSTNIVVGGARTFVKIINRVTNNEDGDLPEYIEFPPIFHALAIIGAWSALEAFMADFCRAVMLEDRTLIENSKEICALKFLAKEILFHSEEQKVDTIYRRMQQTLRKGTGVEIFESVLTPLKLGGSVPDDIEKRIQSAQQIRNVWAHRAGIADSHFIRSAPLLNFNIGDKVVVSDDDTNEYINTLLIYGLIVTSRWRVQNGLPSIVG
ncbi:hypothetical protein [Mycolicibacter heraklionensis]|uniref:hypothetical protein n=1 Tax=Mycolicibacter heraklionensis TaxID=512402 RepID=UPI0010426147|nr:hypothetical protein [Mycolicibacter heraklionensis]